MAGPVQGGHLTIAWETTFEDTMDLHRCTATASIALGGNVLDTVIRKHPVDSTYHPGLAESWEFSDDGLTLTLHLRENVTFHDGTPFNAEAVCYNFHRIETFPEAKGKESYALLGVGTFYEGCEAVDDYTVELTYTKLYANAIDVLTDNLVGGIHSPAAMEKYGDEYGTEVMVGTGPFKLVEWTGPQAEAIFERNEDYNWASDFYNHQGPAYLDGFTFKGILEPSTRVAALESGGVDVALVQPKDATRFDEMPGYRAWTMSAKGCGGLSINLVNPILADIRVRQAISHAVDREALLKAPLYAGVGEVMYASMTEALWGGNMEAEFGEYNYLYDLEKAKALLEEAGWKDEDGDGVREAHGVEGVDDGTKLHLVDQVRPYEQEEHEILQGMWAKAGIEVEVLVTDFSTRETLLFEGDFDIAPWPTGGQSFFVIVEEWKCDGLYNIGKYCSPRIDELYELSFATTDTDKHREYFREVQQILLKDVPTVPLVRSKIVWAMKEEVQDPAVDHLGEALYLYETWIKPESK
jgi:peptide/nickel transport system substrate-binding protein